MTLPKLDFELLTIPCKDGSREVWNCEGTPAKPAKVAKVEGKISRFSNFSGLTPEKRSFKTEAIRADGGCHHRRSGNENRCDSRVLPTAQSFSVVGYGKKMNCMGTPAKVAKAANIETRTASDWREYFEERVAIATIEGEQIEPEARRIAFECCIVRWLDLHPPACSANRCQWCGSTDRPENIIPLCSGAAGYTWLHSRCWQSWNSNRRAEAVVVLQTTGIDEGA